MYTLLPPSQQPPTLQPAPPYPQASTSLHPPCTPTSPRPPHPDLGPPTGVTLPPLKCYNPETLTPKPILTHLGPPGRGDLAEGHRVADVL